MLRWRLPLRVRQWLYRRAVGLTTGDLTRYGVPAPDHRPYETHPIVNSQLVYFVGHGGITPVPDVARFDGTTVVLTDGREVEPDLVVLATGYLPRFEFLPPELLSVDEAGRPQLSLQLFSPTYPTLSITGLVQPDAGLFPISHWQTVLIARWLRLLETAPDVAAAVWTKIRGPVGRSFAHPKMQESTRHWFEVSHWTYLRAIEQALHEVEAAR
jgi:hypothetical protein